MKEEYQVNKSNVKKALNSLNSKVDFKEKVRNAHKQICKDFDYGYEEETDLMFIYINHVKIPVYIEQAYCFPEELTGEFDDDR